MRSSALGPLAALLLSMLGSGPILAATDAAGAVVYAVGVVPQFDARDTLAIWRPILDELEQRAGLRLELHGSPTIPAFEEEFESGKFDLVYLNPYHMLVASKSQGYRPLVRDNGRQLQGILVVHRDSPITELSGLQGQTVAFPSPNALGASLMLRAELLGARGLDIKTHYVKSHDSVYLNVVTGMAAAGGGVQKTLDQQPAQVREQLRVLHRTVGVEPHPLAVHPRVPAGVAARLEQALLSLGEDERGRALLSRVPIKKIGPARIEDYTPLNSLGLTPYYVKE